MVLRRVSTRFFWRLAGSVHWEYRYDFWNVCCVRIAVCRNRTENIFKRLALRIRAIPRLKLFYCEIDINKRNQHEQYFREKLVNILSVMPSRRWTLFRYDRSFISVNKMSIKTTTVRVPNIVRTVENILWTTFLSPLERTEIAHTPEKMYHNTTVLGGGVIWGETDSCIRPQSTSIQLNLKSVLLKNINGQHVICYWSLGPVW